MKRHQRDPMKSFRIHFDHEKEEELKWTQTEMESKVKNILKLIKSINQGNRDANMRKKSEIYQLIDEFHKQYQSLHYLYEDLKVKVLKKIDHSKGNDSSTSPSTSDSEPYYSPDELSSNNSSRRGFDKDGNSRKLESSDSEDTYLKDILTSSSEIRNETLNVKTECDVNEQIKIIKQLANETEDVQSAEEKLVDEFNFLKDKIVESEQKTQSLIKAHETYKKEIKELQGQIFILKLELETLGSEKIEMKEKLEWKEMEVQKLQEKNSKLLNQIVELETTSKNKEDQFSEMLKTFEENEKISSSKTDKLMEEVNSLKHELESLENKRTGSASQLETKSEQFSESLHPQEDFERKVLDIHNNVSEEEIISVENENNHSTIEEEKLQARIIELEKRLCEKEELCLRYEKSQQESTKNLILLKKQNSELIKEVEDHRNESIENKSITNKSNEEHKQCEKKLMELKFNIHQAERKFEEVAEDFRKKFEDNLRILSRRIRVAEQLHVENKDWYRKTKEKYEQESKEVKVSLKKMKDISLFANDMLTALDTTTLKFEDCSAHFMNRVSKVSCELIFAKDWVKRKNKAITHVKDDLDTLLVQLDGKEAEILGLREKVWKLENKLREMEKTLKQKEEGMLCLGEEKREAIRQLCVWMDYHRSRSDHLKKLLASTTERKQTTAK